MRSSPFRSAKPSPNLTLSPLPLFKTPPLVHSPAISETSLFERRSDGETAWAEGLRGIAAVGVVSSHLVLSFARDIVLTSTTGVDGPPSLFQLPIFRLIGSGNGWVALFFILTGYVNSIRPLSHTQANNVEAALLGLAKNSLARIPRLVFPAAFVTILAWLACQLGAFELARHSSAYWLRINSIEPRATWGEAVTSLWWALVDTWTRAENVYDQPQWALPYLLKASFYIFIILLFTAATRSSFRLAVFTLAYGWSWISADDKVGINVFAGMLLAELHTARALPNLATKPAIFRVVPVATAVLGLYVMSYPDSQDFASWVPWSRQLKTIGDQIFFPGSDYGRFWPGVGAQLLCFSVHISPELNNLLSRRMFTFLGGISFSMYLLHGTLMRSVLAWMVFGPAYLSQRAALDVVAAAYADFSSPDPNLGLDPNVVPPQDQIPMPSSPAVFFAIVPAFAAVLILVSWQWTVKVEPHFGRLTRALQRLASKDSGRHCL